MHSQYLPRSGPFPHQRPVVSRFRFGTNYLLGNLAAPISVFRPTLKGDTELLIQFLPFALSTDLSDAWAIGALEYARRASAIFLPNCDSAAQGAMLLEA